MVLCFVFMCGVFIGIGLVAAMTGKQPEELQAAQDRSLDLQSENATLRADIDEWKLQHAEDDQEIAKLTHQVADQFTENAKLRVFMRSIHEKLTICLSDQ